MLAIDRLYEEVEKKGPVCVGLDTCIEYVPEIERRNTANEAEAVLSFNKAIIDAACGIAACFKIQIAYYEELGIAGLYAYSQTLRYIRSKGCIAIADIKRGDIADTASRYAKAHFTGDFEADFVTLNPYMGMDSIEPWLIEAEKNHKGAFVLVRTSNSGMKDFEYLKIYHEPHEPHEPHEGQKRVYHAVADKLSYLAESKKGMYDYGIFGAVVGCTGGEKEEAKEIRKSYPFLFFLIPGYGSQGGTAQDAALLLRGGNGGVVNASRSIITAWKQSGRNDVSNAYAAEAAAQAVLKMREEIRLVSS